MNQDESDIFSMYSNSIEQDDEYDPFEESLIQLDKIYNGYHDQFLFDDPNFVDDIPIFHKRAETLPKNTIFSPTHFKFDIEQVPVANSAFVLDHCNNKYKTHKEHKEISQAIFDNACKNPYLIINPQRIGLIPTNIWIDENITFGQIVSDFFQRKNSATSRFIHKLYNALKISDIGPNFAEYVGVQWLGTYLIKVNKNNFGRLLGIKSIDGSLFHHQGNFYSHGFIELCVSDIRKYKLTKFDLYGVDFLNVRLFVHSNRLFIKDCTESDLNKCKWINHKQQ